MSKERLILVVGIVLLGFTNISCSKKNSSTIHHRELSHDFIVTTVSNDTAKQIEKIIPLSVELDCLDHIKAVTCFTENEQKGFDPNCSFKEIDSDFIIKLSDLIEKIPSFHKKVFCHINRLQIHKKISSIAYASFVQNEKAENISNMIGLNLGTISDQRKNDLFSWKEQLSFGLSKPNDADHSISKQGPHVVMSISQVENSQLLYVLVHEIGHLIDFMNSANSAICSEAEENNKTRVTCKINENSFGKMSWPRTYSYFNDGSDWPPKEIQLKYPLLSKICSYNCREHISPSLIGEVYNELTQSQFTSTYAASNPWEDFAEANAVFALREQGYKYKIINENDEVLFDIDQMVSVDNLKPKMEWFQNFFSKDDLQYQIKAFQ